MVFLFMGLSVASTVSAEVQEYEIKAAFIYNFIGFTEWPEKTGANLNICTLGESPLNIAFDALEKKSAKGVIIRVHRLRIEDSLKDCQVIFLGELDRMSFIKIMNSLKSMPILTVTDSAGLVEEGVMIELGIEERRIVFKINVESAKKSRLMISSKLLRLAKVVY